MLWRRGRPGLRPSRPTTPKVRATAVPLEAASDRQDARRIRPSLRSGTSRTQVKPLLKTASGRRFRARPEWYRDSAHRLPPGSGPAISLPRSSTSLCCAARQTVAPSGAGEVLPLGHGGHEGRAWLGTSAESHRRGRRARMNVPIGAADRGRRHRNTETGTFLSGAANTGLQRIMPSAPEPGGARHVALPAEGDPLRGRPGNRPTCHMTQRDCLSSPFSHVGRRRTKGGTEHDVRHAAHRAPTDRSANGSARIDRATGKRDPHTATSVL